MMLPMLGTALASNPALAQTSVGVQPGRVVRISFDCGERTMNAPPRRTTCRRERGVVVQSDTTGLTWQVGPSSGVKTLPWTAIDRVEVSQGKRRQTLKGLWIGALLGAVPGAVTGANYARLCDCTSPNYAGGAAAGALIFAVPSALLGAGIGTLVRSDVWQEVPADRLRLSVMPRAGGAGMWVAVRF